MEHFGQLIFKCNICGSTCRHAAATLSREVSSCFSCGTTVRVRGIIHALSCALYGRAIPLPDFPVNKEIAGIGMSDWDGYAVPLAEKFAYRNTYLHQEPFFDITQTAETDDSSVDFIISTEVFEHVRPPVSRAFENARRMLKPGGALIFSVPYALTGSTIEHFPQLHDFRIEDRSGQRVLVNTTAGGEVQEFPNLVFHGGDGDTLEMRLFSEPDLLRDLERAGFKDIRIQSSPCFEFGIWHRTMNSLPLIARVEGQAAPYAADAPDIDIAAEVPRPVEVAGSDTAGQTPSSSGPPIRDTTGQGPSAAEPSSRWWRMGRRKNH
jgi:SAM-dependent methyltransferase